MPDVKKTNPKPKKESRQFDTPRVGTVKDPKTGKYEYPK